MVFLMGVMFGPSDSKSFTPCADLAQSIFINTNDNIASCHALSLPLFLLLFFHPFPRLLTAIAVPSMPLLDPLASRGSLDRASLDRASS